MSSQSFRAVPVPIPVVLVPALEEFARRKGVSLESVIRGWVDTRAREARDLRAVRL